MSRGSRVAAAARADEAFATHATWALERTAGMVAQVRPELVFGVILRPGPAALLLVGRSG